MSSAVTLAAKLGDDEAAAVFAGRTLVEMLTSFTLEKKKMPAVNHRRR